MLQGQLRGFFANLLEVRKIKDYNKAYTLPSQMLYIYHKPYILFDIRI